MTHDVTRPPTIKTSNAHTFLSLILLETLCIQYRILVPYLAFDQQLVAVFLEQE